MKKVFNLDICRTRYTRQNTGKQSENAISDNLTNATQIITEGMVKLYDDLHKELIANKNKLIRSRCIIFF